MKTTEVSIAQRLAKTNQKIDRLKKTLKFYEEAAKELESKNKKIAALREAFDVKLENLLDSVDLNKISGEEIVEFAFEKISERVKELMSEKVAPGNPEEDKKLVEKNPAPEKIVEKISVVEKKVEPVFGKKTDPVGKENGEKILTDRKDTGETKLIGEENADKKFLADRNVSNEKNSVDGKADNEKFLTDRKDNDEKIEAKAPVDVEKNETLVDQGAAKNVGTENPESGNRIFNGYHKPGLENSSLPNKNPAPENRKVRWSPPKAF